MSYLSNTEDLSLGSSLGCGGDCSCGPCKSGMSGLDEWYEKEQAAEPSAPAQVAPVMVASPNPPPSGTNPGAGSPRGRKGPKLGLGYYGLRGLGEPAVGPASSSVVEQRLLQDALRRGIRDPRQLSNIIFFARHPSRRGTPILANDVGLIGEWRQIRERIVLPALRQQTQSPRIYPGGFVRGVNQFMPARSGLITPLSSPGLGEPGVQIVSPSPNVSDLVDYLDATVRARGRVTVPTQKVSFLVDDPKKPAWRQRLWEDPSKVSPQVRVTVELVQVGSSLFPISNYRGSVLLNQGFEEYLLRLHSKKPPCSTDYVPAVGSLFDITAQSDLEKKLGIDGQLDTLLKKSSVKLPMSPQDQQRLIWVAYATFPDEIKKYVIPEGRVVLDRFAFDKSLLTPVHIAKINAIARHCVAMAAFTGAGFTVSLGGHTDDRGTEKYNVDLGDRRAAAVKEALRNAIEAISPGLSSQITITPKSFGETKPQVRAKNEAEHALNRRVEVSLPKLKPRCPRVSVRAVVKRALGLVPSLSPPEKVKRISCLLSKVAQKGTDDRWVSAELAQLVNNGSKQFGTYSFALLRDQLSMGGVFGPAVPDAGILSNLELIDGRILDGIAKVTKLIALLTAAASQGINLPTMKAVDDLRAWMNARVNDPQSIYSCYK